LNARNKRKCFSSCLRHLGPSPSQVPQEPRWYSRQPRTVCLAILRHHRACWMGREIQQASQGGSRRAAPPKQALCHAWDSVSEHDQIQRQAASDCVGVDRMTKVWVCKACPCKIGIIWMPGMPIRCQDCGWMD